jgi:hypothetical protein
MKVGICQVLVWFVAFPTYGLCQPPVQNRISKEEFANRYPNIFNTCAQRSATFAKKCLYYQIQKDNMPSAEIYTSDSYIYKNSGTQIMCLSNSSGFTVQKTKSNAIFQLVYAVTTSEIRLRRPPYERFVSANDYKSLSINLFAEKSHQSISAASILSGENILWIQPNFINAGPNNVTYEIVNPGQNDHWKRYGIIEFYDNKDFLIRKLEGVIRMSEDGPIVGSATEEYTYYSPTAIIPVHHLKERISTQSLSKQPNRTNKYLFTDYKIEKLPPERLKLSFYGLPNELVEDETTSYEWLWWTIVLIIPILAIKMYQRYNRMRNSA